MTEQMYFQVAPAHELCECVGVDLTQRQAELIDARPDLKNEIINGALKKGHQNRSCVGDCEVCKGFGIQPFNQAGG